jgi:hypothetical protein
MSLINDALRRARQTQQQSPPASRQPLVPVEPKPRGISRMLPLAVGVLFAAACFFFGLSLARRTPPPVAVAPLPPPKQSDKPVPAPAPVPVAPAPLPEPKVAPATKPAPKLSLSATTANPVVVAPLPPKAVASAAPTAPAAPAKVAAPAAPPPAVPKSPATPPPPPPPEPKLQGIFFDPPRPWAIVSGKTVYAGDRVGDFRVKEISKNTVTLVKADKTLKVLELGR